MSFFEALAFVMTDKCNAECDICCFSCSPRNETLLELTKVKDYIRQASETESIRNIAFTGGEAILFYEQLIECITYAHNLGMRTTLSTNGFWAENKESGNKLIAELINAGLDKISLSVDKYHQKFVSYNAVANAIDICQQNGLLGKISLMDIDDGSSVQEVMLNLRKKLYHKNIIIYPVFPVGRAVKTIPDEMIVREQSVEDARCFFNKSITVMYDGKITLCCSQFGREIDMTTIGQFGDSSLSDVISTFNRNDFIYILLRKGFIWFIEKAAEFGIDTNKKYSSSCELCRFLFTNKSFMEYVRPLVHDEAYQMRMTALLG